MQDAWSLDWRRGGEGGGSASQAGLNGRHSIPRTTPFSSPSTAFHDWIGEEPHPVTPLIGRWPLPVRCDLDLALRRSQCVWNNSINRLPKARGCIGLRFVSGSRSALRSRCVAYPRFGRNAISAATGYRSSHLPITNELDPRGAFRVRMLEAILASFRQNDGYNRSYQ
jgi:hypothetical protein